jgi:hypothetical protein
LAHSLSFTSLWQLTQSVIDHKEHS